MNKEPPKSPKPDSPAAAASGADAATPARSGRRRGGKRGRRRQALGLEEPHRSCIVCRTSKPADELLRFARAPDGAVVFDVRGVLPGRGAWLCPGRRCLQKALEPRHGGFARAFDAAVVLPPALAADVEEGLTASLLGALGLLRRQGRLVCGRDEVVRQAPTAAGAGVACDLAPRSVRDLAAAGLPAPLLTLPPKDALTAALGRGRPVGVIAVLPGAGTLWERVVTAQARWAGVALPVAGAGVDEAGAAAVPADAAGAAGTQDPPARGDEEF